MVFMFRMLRISELLGSIALEMPYKGKRLSMILLLPASEDQSLKELEDSLKKVNDLSSLLNFNAARKNSRLRKSFDYY